MSLKKFITIIGLALSLSYSAPQSLAAASTKDTVELVTALLRGYAAYCEYELRNDASRSAHAKRALIAAIRIVNEICSSKKLCFLKEPYYSHPNYILCINDIIAGINNVHDFMTTEQKEKSTKDPSPKPTPESEDKVLRRFVLPALEMLGALARTDLIMSKSPLGYTNLGDIIIVVSRCAQTFYAAPKNSEMRKFCSVVLLVAIPIYFYFELNRLCTLRKLKLKNLQLTRFVASREPPQ